MRSKIDFNLKNKILKRKNGSRCGLAKDVQHEDKISLQNGPSACKPDLAGKRKAHVACNDRKCVGCNVRTEHYCKFYSMLYVGKFCDHLDPSCDHLDAILMHAVLVSKREAR